MPGVQLCERTIYLFCTFLDCKAQVSTLITYDCCYPDSLAEAKLSAKTTSYTFKLHLSDSLFLSAFAKEVFNEKDVLHLLPTVCVEM